MSKYKFINRWTVAASAVGTISLTTLLAKDKTAPLYQGQETIFGKTVIVTGANCGLGKVTAHKFAERGGRVIMACRNMKKCEAACEEIVKDTFNKNVHCQELDLSSLESIRNFAENINKNEKRLDILINNAGVMSPPERQMTKDGFELQLGVNYLGPFLLTNLLLDKLKSSGPSKIINIVCPAFKFGKIDFRDLNATIYYDEKGRYEQSKLAMFGFGVTLAEKLKDNNVSVYSVNPGYCRDTEIGRHTGLYRSYISSAIFMPMVALLMKTPERGIQTTLYCALSPEVAGHSGRFYEECHENDKLEDKLYQHMNSERLWAISEVWTGLKQS